MVNKTWALKLAKLSVSHSTNYYVTLSKLLLCMGIIIVPPSLVCCEDYTIMIIEKHLEQPLAHSQHPVSFSYYYY